MCGYRAGWRTSVTTRDKPGQANQNAHANYCRIATYEWS